MPCLLWSLRHQRDNNWAETTNIKAFRAECLAKMPWY
jgi:hypothetical protein